MKIATLLSSKDTGAVRLRLLLCTALLGVTGGLGALGLGGTAAAATLPTGFPLSPIYSTATGSPVCDSSDESPTYADVTCNGDLVSAYFGSDGTTVAAAMVLEDSPLVRNGQQPPFQSTTYVVQLGVGGTHQASFGINGKLTHDQDFLYAGCAGASTPHYQVPATTAIADGTIVVVSEVDGSYRLTFHVPLSAFAVCGITGTTPMTPFVGTSQAGPLENINKDFFFGSSVDFTAVNRLPVAVDDAATVPQGTAAALAVLTNDSDPDGDTVSVVSVGTPAHGTRVLLGGVVTYTPGPTFVGTDTFPYTITDGRGGTATANVSVTVTAAANRPPVAVDDVASVEQGATTTVGVLANDSDADLDPLTVTSVTAAGVGTATLVTGVVTYQAPPAFVGTTTFEYTVSDGRGGSDVGLVSVTVRPVLSPNTAPLAVDDATAATAAVSTTVPVLLNDSDPDGDALTVTGVGAASNGTASVVDGVVSYVSMPGFVGVDSFAYTISDGRGGTASAVVHVTVTAPPNRSPVAVDDAVAAPQGIATVVPVLLNDSDPDGDPITVTGVGVAAHGTASLVGGVISYVSGPSFFGSDAFTYTISDGRGGVASASVVVTVPRPANRAPDAVDDAGSAAYGAVVGVLVLVNDSDPDGDPLSVTAVGPAGNGAVTQSAGGLLTYLPAGGFFGTDSFTYTISDGRGGVDTATVRVTVAAPPVVTPDSPIPAPTPSPSAEPAGDPSPHPTVGPTAEPTGQPSAAPSVSPSEIGGVTDPEPATGEEPSAAPTPDVAGPSAAPVDETTGRPAALPFTGGTDGALALGAGLSLLGLLLVLTGRRRSES